MQIPESIRELSREELEAALEKAQRDHRDYMIILRALILRAGGSVTIPSVDIAHADGELEQTRNPADSSWTFRVVKSRLWTQRHAGGG